MAGTELKAFARPDEVRTFERAVMKRSFLAKVSAVALTGAVFFFFCIGPVHAAPSGPLDGKRFKAEAGEKGKPKIEDDEVTFSAGTFHSKGCDAYGFKPGPYKATTAGGVTTFEAVTLSPKEGKIAWKGTVKGDHIEGTYVWTKAGQADIEYWLKGHAVK